MQNPKKSTKINGAEPASHKSSLAEVSERLAALEQRFQRLTGHIENLEVPVATLTSVFGAGGLLLRGGRLPRGLAGKMKQASRSLALANRDCAELDLQLADLQGAIEAAADPTKVKDSGPPVRKSEIDTIEFIGTYKKGRRVYFEFLIDGRLRELPEASGELLKALGSDAGRSPDEFVGFKTEKQLGELFGIDSRALSTRRNRLRKKLGDFDFTPEVVEDHRHGKSWRLRVRRGRSSSWSVTTM